jgi:hypothetical protein
MNKPNFKIKLIERILLINLLPREGKITSLIIVKDLKEKMDISQDEIKKFNIQTVENGITINEVGNKKVFDYYLTELEKAEVKGLLTKLSNESKLPIELLDIAKQIGVN